MPKKRPGRRLPIHNLRHIHRMCKQDKKHGLKELWNDMYEWAEIYNDEVIQPLAAGYQPPEWEKKVFVFIQLQFFGAEQRLRKAMRQLDTGMEKVCVYTLLHEFDKL